MTDLLFARVALRDALRPQRLFTALVLILLPTAVGLLMRLIAPHSQLTNPEKIYDNLIVETVFGFTLTILSVVYGTGIVAQEIEQRTIMYLLTRPFPRWRLLLVKFLVNVVFVAAVCTISAILLAAVIFGPQNIADAGLWVDIRGILIGALAYGAVSLLLGVLVPRPLLAGLFLVFGWEQVASRLPGSFARLSISTYLHVLTLRNQPPPPATDTNNAANFLLSFSRPAYLEISVHEAWLILGLVSFIALATSLVLFSVREYTPREDAA